MWFGLVVYLLITYLRVCFLIASLLGGWVGWLGCVGLAGWLIVLYQWVGCFGRDCVHV